MNGIILMFLMVVMFAWPLAKYMARVFASPHTNWMERFIFRASGIDPRVNMSWQQFLKAMLTVNALWLVYAFFMLAFQGSLPLNPDGNPGQSLHLALNTAVSFLVNCDLQHYSGETGVTYLTQLFVVNFLMFVSAATGISALVAALNGFREKTTRNLGNFWVIFTRSITRVLLPLSIVGAIILSFSGVPASFDGKDTITTLEGDTMQVSRGPAAGMIAIKHIGTNGGGWFGANAAHPLENPSYYTNMLEMVMQMLIPIALIFMMGFYLERRKLARVIFGVMTAGMLCLLIPSLVAETNGNPALADMGIVQPGGAMEGKEVRFGAAASAYWGIMTTIISTGSVNGMHDSYMPVSGLMQLLGMMINAFYGGCGVGLLNYLIYIVVAVFISGLMVGRTPELMGHKVEAREVKTAAIVTLLSAFLVKGFAALAAYMTVHGASWLNNPSYHGFSEMLYEFTSANANNGSGYEGLADNNPFWNISTAIVLLLSRFIPIIGPVAIVGLLAEKKFIPASPGTLRIDSWTFGVVTFAVILVINALSFFPALALGPIAEYFSFK